MLMWFSQPPTFLPDEFGWKATSRSTLKGKDILRDQQVGWDEMALTGPGSQGLQGRGWAVSWVPGSDLRAPKLQRLGLSTPIHCHSVFLNFQLMPGPMEKPGPPRLFRKAWGRQGAQPRPPLLVSLAGSPLWSVSFGTQSCSRTNPWEGNWLCKGLG